jgi:hypothetical protein
VPEVVWEGGPSCTAGLGDRCSDEPAISGLVEVADAGGVEFSESDAGRVEDEQRKSLAVGEHAGDGFDGVGCGWGEIGFRFAWEADCVAVAARVRLDPGRVEHGGDVREGLSDRFALGAAG